MDREILKRKRAPDWIPAEDPIYRVANYRINLKCRHPEMTTPKGKARNITYARENFPDIKPLIEEAFSRGIHIWWFFEPHFEINWVCQDQVKAKAFLDWVIEYLNKKNLNYDLYTPDDGFFCEWAGSTAEEKDFGWQAYAASAPLAYLFYVYQDDIDQGYGIFSQFSRRCHILSNQIGMNYGDESKVYWRSAISCWLFHKFGFQRGLKIAKWLFKPKGNNR